MKSPPQQRRQQPPAPKSRVDWWLAIPMWGMMILVAVFVFVELRRAAAPPPMIVNTVVEERPVFDENQEQLRIERRRWSCLLRGCETVIRDGSD